MGNQVTMNAFFREMEKHNYMVEEEADNVNSYDSYMVRETRREIGFVSFHEDRKPTYHLWSNGI